MTPDILDQLRTRATSLGLHIDVRHLADGTLNPLFARFAEAGRERDFVIARDGRALAFASDDQVIHNFLRAYERTTRA